MKIPLRKQACYQPLLKYTNETTVHGQIVTNAGNLMRPVRSLWT